MSRVCKSLREKALIDSLNSRAGARWLIHSRTCSRCRDEINLLRTLESQGRDGRQHISYQNYSRLVEAVRNQYQSRPRYQKIQVFWNFSWKLCTIAALLMILFRVALPANPGTLPSQYFGLANPEGDGMSLHWIHGEPLQVASAGSSGVALSASGAFSESGVKELFQRLSGSELDQSIYRLRNDVSVQMKHLSRQLTREMEGQF